MKRFFWGLIPLVVLAVHGCDEIAQPLKGTANNSTLPTTPPTYVDSSAVSGANSYTNYKILVEDFMGHFCNNCPTGCQIGDSLINPAKDPSLYNHIVYMQEHAGEDAQVPPSPLMPPGLPADAFTIDYRSNAGNTWFNVFDKLGAVPAGVINRRGNPNFSIYAPYPNWTDTVNAILTPTIPAARATINIHDSCWVPQRIIGVQIQVNIVTALPGASYLLNAVIVQDSIIDWQLDNQVVSGYDSIFVHRNVLRGAFGNNSGGLPDGVETIPASVSGSAGATKTYWLTYDFSKGENGKAASWDMSKCYIIVFITGASTNSTDAYQVIQAEMIKVE